MENRRRFKRFSVNILDINGKILFAHDVKILNLSVGGALIKADRRLNIGGNYVLKLETQEKVLSLKGEVVRSTLSESITNEKGEVVPVYTAGLKFSDLTTEHIDEIAGFISENVIQFEGEDTYDEMDVFKLSGVRLYVRFHIDDPEKATIQFQDNYVVKKISLGGMLIESAQALEVETNYPMEMSINADTIIKFQGRVITCLQVGYDKMERYDIGVEFLQITAQDKELLRTFITSIEKTTHP
jgi:c-di-GMP-binding flagellar brake protein YcgR